MPSTKQSAAQRRALRWAQSSLCAGCGERVPSARRLELHHPDYPTFDHVRPRCDGGGRTLGNGLLKHRRCNLARGRRPPSGCDLIWAALVAARLANRPRTFKAIFKGGVKAPSGLPRRQAPRHPSFSPADGRPATSPT